MTRGRCSRNLIKPQQCTLLSVPREENIFLVRACTATAYALPSLQLQSVDASDPISAAKPHSPPSAAIYSGNGTRFEHGSSFHCLGEILHIVNDLVDELIDRKISGE